MEAPAYRIRPLNSPEEYSFYYQLATNAFSPQPEVEEAERWKRFALTSPTFDPAEVRGLFHKDRQMGGYTLYRRLLKMGESSLLTGCIGAVVTDPDVRQQGVARRLLGDAYSRAQQQNYALLLLDGIPKFYYRFGYVDMFDVTLVEVRQTAILAQAEPAGYHVRPATVKDASAMLGLYQRHSRSFTGSFERSLQEQEHSLSFAETPVVVAISETGDIAGYLFYGKDDEVARGNEILADNWNALLTLLQFHASQLDTQDTERTLEYLLPANGSLTQWMIDTLEVPDTSQWHSPTREWGVRSLTMHHRFTGWMACLVNFPALMTAALPEFQARWQRSLACWTGSVTLKVGEENCTLHFHERSVQLTQNNPAVHYSIDLTTQALVQLIFGYRSLAHLSDLSLLPQEARHALNILFPVNHTWIARSDWF